MIITTSGLKIRYKGYSNILDKIKRENRDGRIFRLTKGVYETDRNVEPIFLAAAILSPSYISFDYALSFYGLIPERVVAITSASLNVRKNKTFENIYGRFEYSDVPTALFPIGTTFILDGDYAARIATKEKAICDSLYKWRVVNSVKELKVLLFEDKRIDEEEFIDCDFNYLIYLASKYKKTNHKLLIKLIKKEYLHG